MQDFIRKLIELRKQEVEIVVFSRNEPEHPSTFKLKPITLVRTFVAMIMMIIVLVLVILQITPLGTAFYDQEDVEVIAMAKELSEKVDAIRDSLKSRDTFLNEIQKVLSSNKDTLFTVMQQRTLDWEAQSQSKKINSLDEFVSSSSKTSLRNVLKTSPLFGSSPSFPTSYPIQGTLTRTFDPQKRHFGIDIASERGTYVRAIESGVVISAHWTLNYGNVIQIQHEDGYISIFKHCSTLLKQEGDLVVRNDLIGTVGEAGVISSGPHLHIELWKNGNPLDPQLYLMAN